MDSGKHFVFLEGVLITRNELEILTSEVFMLYSWYQVLFVCIQMVTKFFVIHFFITLTGLLKSTLSKTISACNTEKCQLVVLFEGAKAIKSLRQ